ncbi:hypothetical protein ES703_43620 [subsurface metagenome]
MIETYYRILKHDPDGKLVKDTGLLPSHSYVIQFLEIFESLFDGIDKDATDVDGNESALIDTSDTMGNYARPAVGPGVDAYGIVVGTNAGTTAEDNENYALDTKIAEGVASGELSYQGVTDVAPRVVGPNIDLDLSRTFLNEHATDPVTVKEIGIICRNETDTKYHLLLRDVVTDEEVAAGYTLTVVYTLRTTA